MPDEHPNRPPLVSFRHAAVVRAGGGIVFRDLTWTLRDGETWAVVGPTGSGKTTFAETLLGRHRLTAGDAEWPLLDRVRAGGRAVSFPSEVVGLVAFRENSRLFSYAGHYYQQRFEFADEAEAPTVEAYLRAGTPVADPDLHATAARLGVSALLPLSFIKLSNGQTRRVRVARALLHEPELLVLDDPFVGLDAAGRDDLAALLGGLVRAGHRLLLVTRPDAVPDWVTHVLELDRGAVAFAGNMRDWAGRGRERPEADATPPQPLPEAGRGFPAPLSPSGRGAGGEGTAPTHAESVNRVGGLPLTPHPSPRRGQGDTTPPSRPGKGAGGLGEVFLRPLTPPVLELHNVSVTHGGKRILDGVAWTVRRGERWALVGPNGSGKTTLLSLVCGDHPQAFSNDVRLFGARRGTGESIWDVKRRVGLVSPELHLYFPGNLTAAESAATGFFDVMAHRLTTPEQDATVRELFAFFGLTDSAGRRFSHLSTGEQRLVLLVRALVKSPPLVVLDEPFQGLDAAAVARAREYLDTRLTTDQTLVFVTHRPEELPHTVTRRLRLDSGRVAEST